VRRVAAFWAIAAVGMWVVGAAARWVPRGALPDPGLLAVVALGLRVGGVPGVLGAFAIGWTADLLSGGLLGQFALLDLLAWAATRVAQRRVDLARPLVLVPFVLGLALGQALGLALLGGVPRPGPEALAVLTRFSIANVVAALGLRPLWTALFDRIDAADPARGPIRLDPGPGLR
jgi:rod shape-determining protein MreD